GHFQDKDGTLCFGGLGGVTSFHPKDLRDQTTVSPPLYITRVRALEDNAEKLTDKTPAYTVTKKINLNSSDRILEVELILLDYERSAENRYAYKLTGQQEQWIYTRENKLTIINPPYGRYNLVIKARGASGDWSDNILTVPVYVPVPFYLQWWFILSALFTLITVMAIAVRWRIRKLKKDRQRLETEVQKRTRKIAEQAEALKTLDKAKSRFFTNITHEFRTPLTLIIGPIEQLLSDNIPASIKTRIQPVKNNAKHLLGLINQLLDITRLESGQTKVKATTTDIVAFSRELVQVFESLAGEKQQQLLFHSEAETWNTHFDREKVSKIVYNLLSNALKYSPEKAIVAFSLYKIESDSGTHIKIEVKDNGMGMAADKLPYIFDRFYQADDSATRKGEGTGIGLALVKELVELMNGNISVESQPGKGSLFTVALPVLPAPQDPDTVSEAALPVILPVASEIKAPPREDDNRTASEMQKLELLIIEDNTQMRTYIRSCVDETVYHITEAADGAEGIAKAQETVPDLIISDVMMPKKDGFEVTHAIRSHIATSHIPLILLTAKASEESRLEGLGRGADAYLTKPFSPKELSLRIKKLIELRKLLQLRYQNQNQDMQQADPVFQKEDHFINELKTYINNHISDPGLNVEAISRHFFISRM
ncbi:MAG: response regulator, partial [Sinomicrobium sp.]|nr:response regulator [Sinomicrobium sp.]